MKQYPKILIISNDCLSEASSNGRTLRNFLLGWPRERLAQFHIHKNMPDKEVCGRFYCVSDKEALQAFLKGKTNSSHHLTNAHASGNVQSVHKRNAVTMLMRELVWNSMKWAKSDFDMWVEEFSPDMILLQAGDCGFMLRLARNLAQRQKIPLVIYNSEAYYFKKFDYFRGKGIAKWIYPLFHRYFCQEFEKTIYYASISIYICDKLKRDYDARFDLPATVIHTATQMYPATEIDHNKPLRISYLGNLGLGRHEGLIEIANILQATLPTVKLDIYGKIPNERVRKAFDNCQGICYCGFVSYERVIEVIHQSDILVHTENFSDFYQEDLKYAFSTKIADSLASGRCFLLYAPKNMACTEYLKENEAAWVAETKEQLSSILQMLCTDLSARQRYVDRALELVEENHRSGKNAQRFQQILFDFAEEKQ